MKNCITMRISISFLLIYGILSNCFYIYATEPQSACIGPSSSEDEKSEEGQLCSISDVTNLDGLNFINSDSTSKDIEPTFSSKKVHIKVKSADEIKDNMDGFNINLKITNQNNRLHDKFNINVIFEEGTCLQLIEEFNTMNNIEINDIMEFCIPIKINKISKDKKERIKFILTRNVKNNKTGKIKQQEVGTYSKEIFIQHYIKKAIIIVPGIAGSEIFTSSAQVINNIQYRKYHRVWPPEDTSTFIPQKAPDQELETEYYNNNSSVESIYEIENSSDMISVKTISECENSSDESEDGTTLYVNKVIGINNIKDIMRDFTNLICNDDGGSKLETMPSYPFNCRKECRKKEGKRFYGAANTYFTIADALLQDENLNDYEVVFFSYDWRRSNRESALELEQYIDKKHYSQVVLVGHSMGGLVCTSYLSKKENKSKIDKFISLGTPFLGANKAINVLETGKFFGGFIGSLIKPIANPLIKKIISNCPSVYELLPPEQTFKLSTANILEMINISNHFCCLGKTTKCQKISSFDAYAQLLTQRHWAPNAMQFFADAQQFHNSLYKHGKSILNCDDINFYNIVGYGFNTIGTAQIIHSIDDDNEMGDLQPIALTDGDGTVTLASATLANTFSTKNQYYVNKINHLSLISNKDVINLVINIINNEPDVFNAKIINKIGPQK